MGESDTVICIALSFYINSSDIVKQLSRLCLSLILNTYLVHLEEYSFFPVFGEEFWRKNIYKANKNMTCKELLNTQSVFREFLSA